MPDHRATAAPCPQPISGEVREYRPLPEQPGVLPWPPHGHLSWLRLIWHQGLGNGLAAAGSDEPAVPRAPEQRERAAGWEPVPG